MISGLQKMTLLDYPGKVACTVFTQGCNFRCPFCHNSDLLGKDGPQTIPTETLLAFLKKRVGLLDAVCITGGEPTLHKELPELITHYRTDKVTIRCDKPTPINLDGELRTAQVAQFTMAQEKLRFFYPKGLSWQV